MKSQNINVLDIYQDPQNPRHEFMEDEAEIVEFLVKEEKIKQLAKDICENGVSPLDIFAVTRDDSGNYIALEGNRRICALRLLNDPDLSPARERKYFEALSEGSDKYPSQVQCIVFSTREEAAIWIERRHNGEQNGVGLVPWNAVQKARFFGESDNTLALKLLEFAEKEGIITEEERKGRLTTATRFLGNPLIRSTLGICSGRSDADVKIDVSEDEFKKVLTRFCRDLVEGTNGVTSRSGKKDWEKYAKLLKSDGVAPTQHGEPQSLTKLGEPTTKPLQERGTKSPDARRHLIPNSFRPKIQDKILKRVFDEACKIDCDVFPLGAVLLTRVFLENVYWRVQEKLTGTFPRDTDKVHLILEKIIPLIEQDVGLSKKEKNALGALKRVKSNENEVFSPKTLGAYAHAGHLPDSKQIKRAWDNIEEIIGYMLRLI
ncbi:hypothetical protein [Pseudomonas indica]|uniref:hypothetical protein n=1 Tax=Pseudomonas indica TaxID=137658 RepID=UPI0023F89D26|nr:hypothetical protein [Pseudomonas indica]MBU3059538.1 hypothetical protein [Pseudomonas indica]